MLPNTRSLHLYHKLDLIPKSIRKKKKKEKEILKTFKESHEKFTCS